VQKQQWLGNLNQFMQGSVRIYTAPEAGELARTAHDPCQNCEACKLCQFNGDGDDHYSHLKGLI
jgi:hypothetical protein